jgi:multiple antibiotic resistance protein
LNAILSSFLLVYAGLFPIVNPVGGAPIFLGLTRQRSDRDRAVIAQRIAINGFFLLVGSVLVGSHVLEFFGITLPIVRIGGGLVVTAFAWQMLHSGDVVDTPDPKEAARPLGPDEVFYPLTMPLTVGPGSIAVAITLGSQRPGSQAGGAAEFAMVAAGALIGIAAVALTIYVCYRYAERMVRVLGEGGTSVLVRLSAFILLCIGIQILWNGYATLTNAAP